TPLSGRTISANVSIATIGTARRGGRHRRRVCRFPANNGGGGTWPGFSTDQLAWRAVGISPLSTVKAPFASLLSSAGLRPSLAKVIRPILSETRNHQHPSRFRIFRECLGRPVQSRFDRRLLPLFRTPPNPSAAPRRGCRLAGLRNRGRVCGGPRALRLDRTCWAGALPAVAKFVEHRLLRASGPSATRDDRAPR